MGQSNSISENTKEHSQEEIVSNTVFETLRSQRNAQYKQQIALLDKVNQEIPTSKSQIQELIDINNKFYQPIKKPDLKGYKYTINGSLTL
jgi:hypothetical protein